MLLVEEARTCRLEAQRLAGKPEAPILLHLAEAFEELAVRKEGALPAHLSVRRPARDVD